jgi:hypothetical protein
MSLKSAVTALSGSADLSNEAYEQYERATNNKIIERDSSNNPILLPSGMYSLIVKQPGTNPHVGNEVDAFRHAYTSAVMAKEHGLNFAHFAGDLNEIGEWIDPGSRGRESNMDRWNNNMGTGFSNLSSKNAIADAIALNLPTESNPNSIFITNLNDSRTYTGLNYLQTLDGNILDDSTTIFFNEIPLTGPKIFGL